MITTTAPRRRCGYCDEPFLAYRNSAQKYCSRECARKVNGKGAANWRIDHGFQSSVAERGALVAQRASTAPLQARLIHDGQTRYLAYSADAVIEMDSLSHEGRPGHIHA